MQPLLIRADAHTTIGAGHVMRCLALAQVRQEAGGEAHFVLAMDEGSIVKRIRSEGMPIHRIHTDPGSEDDAYQTALIAKEIGAKWILADGYHFSSRFQRCIKEQDEMRLLIQDDNCEQNYYYADIILNANLYAAENMYPSSCREVYTKLYLGWKYSILRREFRQARRAKQPAQSTTRILITMGGMDPDNVILKILKALRKLGDIPIKVNVVVAGDNPHFAQIVDCCQDIGDNATILHSVENMAKVMDMANLAISAAGGTCHELIYMNVPFMAVIVADNQVAFAQEAAKRGLCLNLGWHTSFDQEFVANQIAGLINSERKRRWQQKQQRELCQTAFETDWLLKL